METHPFLGLCKLQLRSVPSDLHGTHPGLDEPASEDEQVSEESDEQMFPDIQGRGESPALSCPRLPPPRSILRMGTKKNRNTAKKQSVSAASGPRRKDSSVLGASLSCTVPLGHGSHLQDSWLDLPPDSGCPILLQRVSCPLSVLHSHCTDWRGPAPSG